MVNITYWRWEKLSEECQNEYIEAGMLPDVPWADMENENLLVSQMVIKNGERCWEIQYKGSAKTHIFPEIKQKEISGYSMQYKFNPMRGKYDIDHATEQRKVGYYGMKWLDFMEENYPKLYRQLEKKQTLYAVAQSVNEYASDYKTLLDRQYESLHPRPYEWEYESEHRSWTFTRNFYTDGEVMRERILVPHRTA